MNFKKIVSLFFITALIILAPKAGAQNIGSLKDVVPTGFSFTMDLYPGYTDSDVQQLQKVLNADVDTTVAIDGDGSRGHETRYFGDKTKAAVIKFQEKYRDSVLTPAGLTRGNGIVGKLTRTKLNLLVGVMNTYDSIGVPDSTGTNVTTPSPTPITPVVTNNESAMSDCQFLELLISVGAILPGQANQARSAMSCPLVYTNTTPTLDVKVNGQDGIVTISSARNVTVSWTSTNMTSCSSPGGDKALSGSVSYFVEESGTFVFSCTGPYGTVTDSVAVSLTSDTGTNNTNSVTASCFANPTSVKTGEYVSWIATYSGGNGAYTLNWSGSDSLIGTSQYVSKSYTTAGSKSATVSVTSNGSTVTANCSATVTDAGTNNNNNGSNSLPITAYCSANPYSVYTNATTTWTVVAYGGSNYTYSWSGTDGLTGSSTSVLKSYSTAGQKTGTVAVGSSVSSSTANVNCNASVLAPYDYGYLSTASTTNKVLSLSGGTNDMVTIKQSSSLNLTSKMTLEAWIKPTSWAPGVDETSGVGDNVIISKGDVVGTSTIEYVLSVDNGKLAFSNGKSSLWVCSPVIPLNEWTHVAATIDENVGNVSLYVNGVLKTNICQGARGIFKKESSFNKFTAITESNIVAAANATSTSARNLHIGNFYNPACSADSQNGFIGEIDDVRIWSIPRSAFDIATSSKKSVKGATGLVAQYTFDDSSMKDSTTFANNGFQKGSAQAIEDITAMSAIATSTVSTSYSNFNYLSPTSYSDPDGLCLPEEPEVPEEVAPVEQFWGIVESVKECLPTNSTPMKLTQVKIKPCSTAGTSMVAILHTGETISSNAYIVIRDGYQKVPAVGESIRGEAVHDGGHECTNGDGELIGTVSGPLDAKPGDTCAAEQAATTNGQSGIDWNPFSGVETWEYFVPPVAVTHALVNTVSNIGHAFGL